MTHERDGRRSLARAAITLLLLAAVASAGGCRFLADELTTLDRRAPKLVAVPDAPVSGLVDRP